MYGNYGSLNEGTQAVDATYDEKVEVFTTTLTLRHMFGDGVSAALSLPVGMLHYTYKDSSNKIDVDRRITGLGDMSLSARYEMGTLWGQKGYKPSLLAHFSVGLPSGASLETESEIEPGGPVAETTAPPILLGLGMGTYTGILGLDFTQYVHPSIAIRIPLWARFPFHENKDRVFYGNRYGYGLGIMVMPTSWMILATEVNGQYAMRSEYGDRGKVEKSGGHWLGAELQVGLRISKRVFWSAKGRLPVATKTNGRQLTETFSMGTALSVNFGLPDDESEE